MPETTRAERLEAVVAELNGTAAPTTAPPEAPKAEAPKAEEPKVEAKPEASKPPEEPAKAPSDTIRASFDRLAQEKAAWRKEMDAEKPYIEALKKAKLTNDPLAALSALGYSYADVAHKMLDLTPGAKPRAAPEPSKENSLPPEVDEIRKELAVLRQEREERQREQILGKIKTATENRKLIKSLGEEHTVMRYVEDFYNRTGSLPGKDFEETIAIASEAVEAQLETQAAKWRSALGAETSKPLTPAPATTTVPTSAREALAGQETSGKTLTNAAASTPRTDAPKSREEILKEILADPKLGW